MKGDRILSRRADVKVDSSTLRAESHLMSLAISIAALVFSISTFLHGRWRDKRDLILRIHEHLVSADQQRGRRLLYEMKEAQTRAEDLSDDDYSLINNALAALNVLGIYYQRRYVRRKDVLELWGLSVLRIFLAGDDFIAYRDTEDIPASECIVPSRTKGFTGPQTPPSDHTAGVRATGGTSTCMYATVSS